MPREAQETAKFRRRSKSGGGAWFYVNADVLERVLKHQKMNPKLQDGEFRTYAAKDGKYCKIIIKVVPPQ